MMVPTPTQEHGEPMGHVYVDITLTNIFLKTCDGIVLGNECLIGVLAADRALAAAEKSRMRWQLRILSLYSA